ncbi:NAD-dependent malic enzyme [Bacillus pinisoli]|uniref:NAD-dependent malic enzyme n=1 Tax=Bacillus pinisoli TaxID=2901866 RepID=UPI001FF5E2E8|nr:NAD-dependent malic enzyme [Bacillus pinisoli]
MASMSKSSMNIIIRLQIEKQLASFSDIAKVIGEYHGDIVGIDVISSSKNRTIRDITINVNDQKHSEEITSNISNISGVEVISVSDRTFLLHLGGKIEVNSKVPIKNRDDLSRVYTPGVAQVCKAIAEKPSKAHTLTIKRNTVAVVSDGTAVLGLGDIGPLAAMPVMEGKAMLFKQMANVDSFPICLDTKDTEEIIQIIKAIAPAFGGINLEDIASPRCFEIEERLKKELDIPVFHDDQHGTAVVILAGLINALKLTGKELKDIKVVLTGIGAAGIACTKILVAAGVKNVIGVDRFGAINRHETYENLQWEEYKNFTNPDNLTGGLDEVIEDADVFIGVSAPGILTVNHLKKMAKDPIVFALANPQPEIDPDTAEGYVRVMATGRSDFPNQINNVLCFPGIFRGALDCRATEINEEMKIAAARAIANVVSEDELSETYIIPSVFNQKVVDAVKTAVIQAAYKTGVARKDRLKLESQMDKELVEV